ncbi:flavodoxin domain-containing protein [Bacillus pinisoli]|uniref:flavodoxin domain-containing protein n=1 Tax=Bacillus pinisoli TaxID=2901866 RepID=UPI001FF52D27|nr:flavodoxin domain-containing protein [Bacillus pinisoli]
MRVAIIYASGTGNTEEVATAIHSYMGGELYKVGDFPLSQLTHYDAILIGSYTWGNGELPKEMRSVYQAIEELSLKSLVTGVFGTGDSFYPKFCGAVDVLRDMLAVHTNLAVTLKIEQMPQAEDFVKCRMFVDRVLARLEGKKTA